MIGYEAQAVRDAEAPLLDSGVDLMSQAAFALSRHLITAIRDRERPIPGARVVLLVGAGNNGGDGLFAGALLARRGVSVLAILTAAQVHEAGLAALRAAGGNIMSIVGEQAQWLGDAVAEAFAADVVADALLGIGASGAMRGAAAQLVATLAGLLAADGSTSRPSVVAVDVPSGIGVDDGTLPGPYLPADVTVTFGAPKAGLLLPPAANIVGRLVTVPIGLDFAAAPTVHRLQVADVAELWPWPAASDHKYLRGVVGVVAGSERFPGAAVLSCSGAVRAGAGMVRLLGPSVVTQLVLNARPEVVPTDGQVQAWVLGPGVCVDSPTQARTIERILRSLTVPAVIDAGALELLPPLLPHVPVPAHLVLTPHAGELARLLAALGESVTRAEVAAAPLHWLRRCVQLTGATVLLKGATTLVADATGAVYSQEDGTAWLATAGAGDVLAGVLGAMLAAAGAGEVRADGEADNGTGREAGSLEQAFGALWVDLAEIAAAAALVHGLAGKLASCPIARASGLRDKLTGELDLAAAGSGPIAALDIAAALPAVIASW